MKRYIRPITAAAADEDSRLEDAIDILEDDFEYVISGLEKLGRTNTSARNQALQFASQLHAAIQDTTSEIADNIQEVTTNDQEI